MGTSADDPLALGQRIVAILDSGARTATYKLATLMALIDHCVENFPADRDASLAVPLDALAARVIELYWPQVRPFESQELKQSTQSVAKILRTVQSLRETTGAGMSGTSLAVASRRAPEAFDAAVDQVVLVLVQQPVHRLQKLPGGDSAPFLFDDSWMNSGVSRRTIALHGDSITLFPGVAYGLGRLSGLVKPVLESLWVEDVRRMNRWLDAEVPDVAGHLFGRDRIALAPARQVLKQAFGPHCFYCGAQVPVDNPVDHVLPWTRVGIDGLANLVLACRRCNGDKLHALPSVDLMTRALERDRVTMEQLAEASAWPTQYERVTAAARGVFRGEPSGSPTWNGYRRSRRLDITYAPDWLRVDL